MNRGSIIAWVKQRDPAALLWLALAAMAGGALVRRGPVLLGHANGEGETHVWIQYLLRRVLEGRNPLVHDDVTLGEVLRLYPTDMVVRFPAALAGALVGDPAAYNLCALAQVALAGWIAVALARELGARRWPSVAAGLVLVLHPGYLGFLACGRADSLSLGWLLLVCLMWLRLVRSPGRVAGLKLGLTLGLLVGASPNLAFLAAWLITALSLIALVRKGWRALLAPLALAAVSGAALGACFAGLLVWAELDQDKRLGEGPQFPATSTPGEQLPQASLPPLPRPGNRPLVEWVEPAAVAQDLTCLGRKIARLLQRERISGIWYEVPVSVRDRIDPRSIRALSGASPWAQGGWPYLALVPLVLLALCAVRRPRQLLPWLAAYLVLQLLALGSGLPHADPLSIPGQASLLVLRPGNLLSALPGGGLFQNFALFNSLAAAVLGLGLALGLNHLAGARWSGRVGCVLLALWVIEVQALSPTPLPLPTTRLEVPPTMQAALRRGREQVVVLPQNTGNAGFLLRYHGRHTNIIWNNPLRNDVASPLFRAFKHGGGTPGARVVLRQMKADTVVIFTGLWPEAFSAAFVAWLERDLGPPAWRSPGGGMVVFVAR